LALSTGASENTDPLIIMWGARGINVIGNVLGDSSYQVQYILSPTTGSGNADKSIYLMGYRGNQATGATDNLVQSSAMLWGNYDTVNAAVRWNSTEASPAAIPFLNANFTSSYFSSLAHTLPTSFYLASKPAFYTMQSGITQPPYPFAGPDVTGGSGPGGFSYANPAQACYNSLTLTNGIAKFDAAACYYGSPSQAYPPSCSPGTGSYSSAQSVVCTNPNSGTTIMCYAINASPSTNDLGTACAGGTQYTTPIIISTSETLNVIAGTSTLPDSTVSSYTYTITTNATAPSCTPGSGQFSQVEVVTCTNPNAGTTVMCYSTTTTPATNGLGTACTTGTVYSTALLFTANTTLNVIAGTSTQVDSSVASYAYTIVGSTLRRGEWTGSYIQ
jgi:hypothetical protein